MIPEEDRGPAWLRDYGGAIEADIQRMEEFAAQLEAEVQQNYGPHMQKVVTDMTAPLPGPAEDFAELLSFMQTHQSAQQGTSVLITDVGNATGGFAFAAKEVSQNYGDADAFSAARVRDVETALDKTRAAAPPAPGTENAPAPGNTDDSGVPDA